MFSLPVLGLDLGEHVRLAEDQQVLAVDLDLRAAVLGVEDLVTLGDVEGDALLAVLVPLAVADGEDLALLRLLLRGVGEDDAGRGRLLLLDRLDDQPIAQGLELHSLTSTGSGTVGTLDRRVPAAPMIRRPHAESRVSWHSRPSSANS